MGGSRRTGRASWPAGLTAIGQEPDPRFTLANERTLLAWNRTALALIGGGLAAGQLIDFASQAARLAASLSPIGLAAALGVVSLRRWWRVERALRLREPLPLAAASVALGAAVCILAVSAIVAVLLEVSR